MFKKITFRMMVLAVVAMVAGTVSAQEPVWTGKVTAADYVQGGEIYAPEIDYSITYTADKHLHLVCTFSEEAVSLVPQFSFDGQILGMTSLGDSKYEIVSTSTYEEGVTLNMFFYLAHSNPTASRADVTYVVGSDNQTVDEDAPEFVNVGYAAGAAGYDSVTLTISVTDNSGNAIVEVYDDEACENLLVSQDIVADGNGQTVVVENLEPETSYTLYIKVKDAAGNYADDVKAIEVTTTEAPEITETTWYGTITAADYMDGLNAFAPVINYSITYTTDKHLRVHCTLSEFNDNNVQVNFRDAGNFEVMSMVEGNNLEYELVSADTYEAGEELNNAFFYLAYPDAASRANFTYTVGAANEAPEADVEKPVLTNVTVSDVQDKTAVLNVTVTDNSGVAVITVSGDNFETAEFTVTADGTAQTVELEGLTPETYYDLTVGAKDIAGNVADNVISIDFTTTQEVIYEEVTVTGHVSSDKSEWDPGCNKDAEYFPAFSYKVTTKGDNTLAFEVTMDDADYDYAGVARAFVKGGRFELACAEGAKVYTGVTTQSYERGSTVDVYFRFIPVGSAEVWTLPFYVEIGEEVEAGVAGLQTGNVAIYAANGNLTVAGAEGETVRVYAVSGALVYEAVASGNETISLEKGMYIVVAGKEAKKVIL